jgi:hypothetical protein
MTLKSEAILSDRSVASEAANAAAGKEPQS